RPRARILLLVLVARGESLTRRVARTGIDPRLQALAVDVVHEALHVGELLVRENLAVPVTPGGRVVASLGPLVPPGFPCVVDVDVGVALRGEAGLDHAVGGRADVIRGHVAAPDVPGVPAERRRQRERVLAADDRDHGVAHFAVGRFHRYGNLAPAFLLKAAGDDAGLLVERQPGRQVLHAEGERVRTGRRNPEEEGTARRRAGDAGVVDHRHR